MGIKVIEKAVGITAIEAGSYQVDQVFPVGVEDEVFDKTLLSNQLASFRAYPGRGNCYIWSDHWEGFAIYINQKSLPMVGLKNGKWYEVDLSAYTVLGNNRIQVSQLSFEETHTLKVKVPYPTLIAESSLDQSPIGQDAFNLIDQLITAEIKHGFTSAQVVITKEGRVLKNSAYGTVNAYAKDGKRLKDSPAVTKDTLYDLASNTKMYATNFALQKLVSDGVLDLDTPVQAIFPAFKDRKTDKIKGKSQITIRSLLQHRAGFYASPPYHRDTIRVGGHEVPNPLYTHKREEVLQKICETPLLKPPFSEPHYSDVDYMLLAFIIEKVTQQRLDDYVREQFYRPIGLTHTTFRPLDNGFSKAQIAATELNGNTRDGVTTFSNVRQETIQGEVHDEKAFYTMEGISGHAGLFSTASDLAILTQVILNRGGYGTQRFFDEDTLDEFMAPTAHYSSFALGWRRKGKYAYNWVYSPLADTNTIGHTGWVGTLTIIDPIDHLTAVILTNAKNSPVLDPSHNTVDFYGNHFLTGSYGLLAALIFDGTLQHAPVSDEIAANNAKLIAMTIQKATAIISNPESKTKADRQSYLALIDVLKERKSSSKAIQQFLVSRQVNDVTKLLNNY